jgi:uncharacterized protein DUF4232
MNDVDQEVRDLLREKANDIPPNLDLPRSLTTRVRRRIALNALAVTVTVVVVAAGAFGTIRAFRSQPSETEGTPACTSADVRAVVSLQGAAGSREGTIELTNTSATCSLKGTPTLNLLDEDLHPIVSGITFVSVPAGWEVGGSPQPAGWPVVSLARDDSASVRVRWSNWCAGGNSTPHWRIAIPGSGDVDVEGIDAVAIPPCNGSDLPSTIEVGPFEPHLG